MRKLTSLIAMCVSLVFVTAVHASDEAVVKAFYTKLLSDPNAPNIAERVRDVVVEDWVSIPTPRGGKGAAGLIKTLKKFGGSIDNMTWEPQEILRDGNRFIVRSIASGTPKGKFFGKPAKGAYKIMTIDIHEVKDGKIVQSYHVEDWARALRQVSVKQ